MLLLVLHFCLQLACGRRCVHSPVVKMAEIGDWRVSGDGCHNAIVLHTMYSHTIGSHNSIMSQCYKLFME